VCNRIPKSAGALGFPSALGSCKNRAAWPRRRSPSTKLKGSQAQAAKLTEWLKARPRRTAPAEKPLAPATNLGVVVSGPAGVGKTTMVRRGMRRGGRAGRSGRTGDRRAWPPKIGSKRVASGGDNHSQWRRCAADHRCRCANLPTTAEPVAALIPARACATAVATDGVALDRHLCAPRPARCTVAGRARTVLTGNWALPAGPDATTRKALLETLLKVGTPPGSSLLDGKLPSAHQDSLQADLAALVARSGAAGSRRGPAPTASRPN